MSNQYDDPCTKEGMQAFMSHGRIGTAQQAADRLNVRRNKINWFIKNGDARFYILMRGKNEDGSEVIRLVLFRSKNIAGNSTIETVGKGLIAQGYYEDLLSKNIIAVWHNDTVAESPQATLAFMQELKEMGFNIDARTYLPSQIAFCPHTSTMFYERMQADKITTYQMDVRCRKIISNFYETWPEARDHLLQGTPTNG